METLYKKVGNKYEPVGYTNVPDLYDGVWLVQRREHSKSTSGLIWRLGDIPMADVNLFVSLFKYEDDISSFLVKMSDETSDEFKQSGLKKAPKYYDVSAVEYASIIIKKLGTLIQSEKQENFTKRESFKNRKSKIDNIKKLTLLKEIISKIKEGNDVLDKLKNIDSSIIDELILTLE